jgi:hypothetical protein
MSIARIDESGNNSQDQSDFEIGAGCGRDDGLDLQGMYILLANINGGYSMDGLCSPLKGRLWEGSLMGNIVKCPQHGSASICLL